jgi:hypothetical protein
MSKIGEIERRTQNRVVSFLKDLPAYHYLGTWEYQPRTTNIEIDLLTDWLHSRGHGAEIVRKAVRHLTKTAALGGAQTLAEVNRAVHDLLRYEARDIDQQITNQAAVDQWFETKTARLTDIARAEIKKRWGTMASRRSLPSTRRTTSCSPPTSAKARTRRCTRLMRSRRR